MLENVLVVITQCEESYRIIEIEKTARCFFLKQLMA